MWLGGAPHVVVGTLLRSTFFSSLTAVPSDRMLLGAYKWPVLVALMKYMLLLISLNIGLLIPVSFFLLGCHHLDNFSSLVNWDS